MTWFKEKQLALIVCLPLLAACFVLAECRFLVGGFYIGEGL